MTARRFIADLQQLGRLAQALGRQPSPAAPGVLELEEIAPGVFGLPLPNARTAPRLPGRFESIRQNAQRVRRAFQDAERELNGNHPRHR